MPLQLVSMVEIREAIAQLTVVEFEGQPYVNARDLARAVGDLTGERPLLSERIKEQEQFALDQWNKGLAVDPAKFEEPALGARLDDGALPTTLELEQRRLNSLPLGPCATCHHVDHDYGECVECGCQIYIDTVNRDPVVSLAERGIVAAGEDGAASINAGGVIPPAISPFGAEAGLPNWKERPPLGHHRPPSG